MSDGVTHYLNSDFDLGLRPRPGQLNQPRLVRQVSELSAQALLGAEAGDAVLLRADVPPEFVDHLVACGLPAPRLLRHPRIDPDSSLRPFGWSAEAIELNRRHRRPVEHPPFGRVRRVNSRSFSRALERELACDGGGRLVDSVAELESLLADAPPDAQWVIKSEHGNAGLGNRRLRGSRLRAADRGFVERRLAEDDRLVLEPWLPRARDWCVVFEVPWNPAALRVHEQVCTSDGALIGALFEPGGCDVRPWTDELAVTAHRVADRLEDEGYFGPACIDAFEWRDGETMRLRPLVDLNCRRAMSDHAQRLWRRLLSDRVLYYRFFNRRKLTLPDGLAPTLAALEDRRYDSRRREGILPASPTGLLHDGKSRRPGKLAVIFVARQRTGVFALERWFRDRFEA